MMVDNPPSAGEVRAFAQQLLAWADRLVQSRRPCRVLADADRHGFVLALAEAARERARLCSQAFPEASFVSPAWRILLEVFIRESAGYRVSLDDLAEWGELPLLTVLGSLNGLIEKGLIERGEPDNASRIVRIALSPATRQRLSDLLLECAGQTPELDVLPDRACMAGGHR
jgi:DNA-binding MarR family transcriptional regulator